MQSTLIALLIGLLVATPGQAASVSYFLNQSDKLADGINYLQVTISDEGAPGAIDFKVVALQPLLDLAGEDFGIQKFAFNILAGVGAEARSVKLLPPDWRARNGGRMDGFGLYDITLKAKGARDPNRQDPLTFSITGVEFDTIQSYVELSHGRAPQGFSLFSAQVGGLNFGNCGKQPSGTSGGGEGHSDSEGGGGRCIHSAYFGGNGSAVPAPPALWLLGTAVAGLAGRRFRGRKTTT